ncbi:hypothetical protein CLV62_1045 [Dysgonomonas alginatilytica]|uniref:Uncharacterized protein n=1 Tax=Dysgonomonas alginatilytica TaxID=1605892 RepID=A0A2V3PTV8_9BACT|nr:hypothetical protein CLV62_1045 [Dysgonomonas alginatilytica]
MAKDKTTLQLFSPIELFLPIGNKRMGSDFRVSTKMK